MLPVCVLNRLPVFLPVFTRGRGGIGRGSVASRGALVTQSNPASAAGTRDTPSHRGRGAPAKPGYRPPLLPITHESYEDYVSRPTSHIQYPGRVYAACTLYQRIQCEKQRANYFNVLKCIQDQHNKVLSQ